MINNNFYKNNFYKLLIYMCMYVCPYIVQMILNIRIDYMNIDVCHRRHSSQNAFVKAKIQGRKNFLFFLIFFNRVFKQGI